MRCPKCGVEAAPGKAVLRRLRRAAAVSLPQMWRRGASRQTILRRLRRATGGRSSLAPAGKPGLASERRPRRGRSGGGSRGRAQDGHGAVRRHQGIDGADGGPRSRGGARDRRSRTEADDRRGASLRRYVVQSTGDGIFALFGAPVAHEDHPQRALYAALRMQEELKRYSAQMREPGACRSKRASG